jgi:transposase
MSQEITFDQVIKVGCGADIHKDLIVATIRRSNTDYETREFGAYTSSLTELREWCKSEGVTHFAMESTGVYWKPVFNILDEDSEMEVILVNARHVKNVPGHKTDKKDSVWLSKLLLSGLLKASFIPDSNIRELRDLVRYKKKIIQQRASEKNRIIRILEDGNIKLSSVLTKVNGATGQRIIEDIVLGITDARRLARHYHGKIKKSKKEFILALEGRLTDHHKFMLSTIRKSITDKDALIAQIEEEIDSHIQDYEEDIVNLSTIDGVDRDSAITIISETGVDMDQFPSEKHLSSWAGLSPGNNESGGKKKPLKQ